MTVSLRLSESEAEIIKAYANMNGMTVSTLLRSSVMERIENEYDLKSYEEAMEDYKKDNTTFPLEEVIKELGLE